MKSKIAKRVLLLALSTLAVGGLAEFAYRALRTTPPPTMHFRFGDRRLLPDEPTAEENLAFLMQIQVPWPRPGLPPGFPTTPPVGQQNPWFGTG